MMLINVAAHFAIVIAVYGYIPHPTVNTKEAVINNKHVDNSERIPHWLKSTLFFLKKQVREDSVREDKPDLSIEENDDTLRVLIYKEDELSRMKLPSISGAGKTKPFIRQKRSNFVLPTNLPRMVRDLNSHLTSSQFEDLFNPQTLAPRSIPDNQENTCPEATNCSWSHSNSSQSTCPWKITQLDLGSNATPRYINKAICLCEVCIGFPTRRCDEIHQTVFYLYSHGYQDEDHVMEQRQITITVECYCVQSNPGSTERQGPISN